MIFCLSEASSSIDFLRKAYCALSAFDISLMAMSLSAISRSICFCFLSMMALRFYESFSDTVKRLAKSDLVSEIVNYAVCMVGGRERFEKVF